MEYDYSLLASFGTDVYISNNVELKRPKQITIGNHVAIDSYNYWTTRVRVDDYVHIAPFVSIIGGIDAKVIISNFCTIAAGSRLIARGDEHLGAGLVSPVIPEKYRDNIIGSWIILQPFVGLGTNVIIMPDVKIAEGVVIGANSLVTKSITEKWTIWVGNPARKLKDRRSDKMLEYAKQLGYNYDR